MTPQLVGAPFPWAFRIVGCREEVDYAGMPRRGCHGSSASDVCLVQLWGVRDVYHSYDSTSDHYDSTSDHYDSTSDHYDSTSDHYDSTSDHYDSTSDHYDSTSDHYDSTSDDGSVGDCWV